MCDSLRPHGLQQARLPCPSPSPRVCSKSRPWSRWCHPTISSSTVPFYSCPQSFPAPRYFPMSWLFTPGGQSIGASLLPRNIQGWFPLGLTVLISLLSKGLSRVFSSISSQSVVWGPRNTPRTFPRNLWSSFSDYTSGWGQIYFLSK